MTLSVGLPNLNVFLALSYSYFHNGIEIVPFTCVNAYTPKLTMPNYTSLSYVFKLPSHILFNPSTYSLLALNAKLPSFYYSPLRTTAIFLHKNFTHWLSKNSLLPHTDVFLTLTKCALKNFTGQLLFYRATFTKPL